MPQLHTKLSECREITRARKAMKKVKKVWRIFWPERNSNKETRVEWASQYGIIQPWH
jgi:hypothetical protein